jgi:hypothetical protein
MKFRVGDKVKINGNATHKFSTHIDRSVLTVNETINEGTINEYVLVTYDGMSDMDPRYGIYVTDIHKINTKSIIDILNKSE